MATFVSPIKGFFSRIINKRFNRWLKRRIPPASQHKLSNRNIFIMPSRFGFVYLIFVVLLFLLATNYQNNAIMLLSYLMASVFITTMMHSFFNLSGIALSADKKAAGYANTQIAFPIQISSPNKRVNLNFCFDDQQAFHLPQVIQGEQTVYVSCHYENRVRDSLEGNWVEECVRGAVYACAALYERMTKAVTNEMVSELF